MPIVKSNYNAPHFFKNGHFATIYSGIFRKVNGVVQERERITLSDGDFLDLDWSISASKTNKLVIILHGLEGNAERPYMLGSAKHFNLHNYDVVCVNFRGCSGEINTKYRSYHSGSTDDLEDVIQHILESKNYEAIYIKGFSLGGNVALKYLGERNEIQKEIKAAVAISVPCSLSGSCKELHKFKNVLYHDRFRKRLKDKLKQKQLLFPEKISKDHIQSIKTLKDFDDVYTSKAHGFRDALDYYERCSSLQFLNNINIPTLILNAMNDSFLSPECYPEKEANSNSKLFLEMPDHGDMLDFMSMVMSIIMRKED